MMEDSRNLCFLTPDMTGSDIEQRSHLTDTAQTHVTCISQRTAPNPKTLSSKQDNFFHGTFAPLYSTSMDSFQHIRSAQHASKVHQDIHTAHIRLHTRCTKEHGSISHMWTHSYNFRIRPCILSRAGLLCFRNTQRDIPKDILLRTSTPKRILCIAPLTGISRTICRITHKWNFVISKNMNWGIIEHIYFSIKPALIYTMYTSIYLLCMFRMFNGTSDIYDSFLIRKNPQSILKRNFVQHYFG